LRDIRISEVIGDWPKRKKVTHSIEKSDDHNGKIIAQNGRESRQIRRSANIPILEHWDVRNRRSD
jgi:predicted RNA-binding protein YlqC (UPF0109 family)